MYQPPTRITFKGTAVGLICCAIVVAFLNLYMNFLASRSSSSFQIDLSADGDVVAFHQFEFPGAGDGGKGGGASAIPSDRQHRNRRGQSSKVKQPHGHEDHHHGDSASASACMGLCPGHGSLFTQVDFVKQLIHGRLKNLPSNAFRVELEKVDTSKKHASSVDPNNATYYRDIWLRSYEWVLPRRISAPNDRLFAELSAAMTSVRVIRASTPTKGTQLKAMLDLDGGQRAVWKPQFLKRSDVVDGGPTDGPDRHNGEIAAFHIGHLLGLDRTPFVSGRILNIRSEIYDVADKPLRDTFFVHNRTGRFCFYGKCLYCKPSSAACADDGQDRLEGALVLWFPSAYSNLTRVRSPWARTYDPNRLATWQTNATSFCRSVLAHEMFGKSPVFLDLMETAVFDFLIGNADRHRLEFFKDAQPRALLLLDNGKSFGNPRVDELTILAPLYQCCRIRRRLYQRLLRYSEINFGALLNERYLRHDPLYPVLTESHLEAVNRRLRKVLTLVAACTEQHGPDSVLVDDGY